MNWKRRKSKRDGPTAPASPSSSDSVFATPPFQKKRMRFSAPSEHEESENEWIDANEALDDPGFEILLPGASNEISAVLETMGEVDEDLYLDAFSVESEQGGILWFQKMLNMLTRSMVVSGQLYHGEEFQKTVTIKKNWREFWESLKLWDDELASIDEVTEKVKRMITEKYSRIHLVGPQTFRLYGVCYPLYLRVNALMMITVVGTVLATRYRYQAETSVFDDDDEDLDIRQLKVGDHITLRNTEGLPWVARITDISNHGVRLISFWLPGQTWLKGAARFLHPKLLFATRGCQCRSSRWLGMDVIKRRVKVVYCRTSERIPDGDYDFFCSLLYCLDNLEIIPLPDEIRNQNPTPLDLCQCSDGADETNLPHKTKHRANLDHRIALCKRRSFKPGQFFSVKRKGTNLEDVIEVCHFDRRRPRLEFRTFSRPVEKNSLHNELIWGNFFESFDTWPEILHVGEACHVQYVPADEDLSDDLRYHGAGRRFFFRNVPQNESSYPPPEPVIPLKTLDVYCGAGSFSLGFEDSGAAEVVRAIDFNADAVASYNRRHLKTGRQPAVLSSVSQFLAKQVNGEKESFDAILASPPCQDFSSLNRKPQERGRANIATIATLMECFEKTKLFIVENVSLFAAERRWPEMDVFGAGDDKFTPFYLLLAFAISRKYSVRWSIVPSSPYGTGQIRNRTILILAVSNCGTAAPDFPLPMLPIPSHLSDGPNVNFYAVPMKFAGDRISFFAPFKTAPCRKRTVEDVIGHLPSPPFGTKNKRFPHHSLIKKVACRENIPADSRVKADGYFSTITTTISSGGKLKGAHYQQNRPLTVHEVALAQGFFPEEIPMLQGTTKASLTRQIGNAVPKGLAFAIGCEVAKVLPKGKRRERRVEFVIELGGDEEDSDVDGDSIDEFDEENLTIVGSDDDLIAMDDGNENYDGDEGEEEDEEEPTFSVLLG
ncbi:DNA methyltransferase Dim-2 [Blyttiomyces sp. JEL0837]|nr:DNA methyltransferase Dim-2 [Blyttiomyces sp. JEL0837]